jgi:hypothetical protein
MTGALELPDFGCVEKGPPADEAGRDEEMTPPASAAQLVADPDGTLPAVIERQDQVAARPGEIDGVHSLRGQ